MGETNETEKEIERIKALLEGNGKPGYHDVIDVLWGNKHSPNPGIVTEVDRHAHALRGIENDRKRQRAWLRGIAIGIAIPVGDTLVSRVPDLLRLLSW